MSDESAKNVISKPTIDRLERITEQEAVKEKDCREEVPLPAEFRKIYPVILKMLLASGSMWDG